MCYFETIQYQHTIPNDKHLLLFSLKGFCRLMYLLDSTSNIYWLCVMQSTKNSDIFARTWCFATRLTYVHIRPVGFNSINSPVLASKRSVYFWIFPLGCHLNLVHLTVCFVALYSGQWASLLHVGAVPTPPLMKDQGKAMVTMEILTRNKPWVETSHCFTSLPKKKNPGVSQHSWDGNMCCLLSIFITQ